MSTIAPVPGIPYQWDSTARVYRAAGRPSLPAGRDSLIVGQFFPDETTVGHITPLNELEQITSVTSTTFRNGGEYEGLWIRAYMNATWSDAEFRDSRFSGPSNPNALQTRGLVINSGLHRNRYADCTFDPEFKHSGADNLMGHHYEAERCDLKNAVDAIGANPPPGSSDLDVAILSCWLHDLTFFCPCPGWSHKDNATHNDVCQVHGGSGFTFRGNRAEGFYTLAYSQGANQPVVYDPDPPDPAQLGVRQLSGNVGWPIGLHSTSVIMTAPGSPPCSRFYIEENWINGGANGIQLAAGPATSFPEGDGSYVRRNRFGLDHRFRRNALGPGKSDYGFVARDNFASRYYDNVVWDLAEPLKPFELSTPHPYRKAG